MLKYLAGKSPISFASSGFGYAEEEPVETPFGHLQSFLWYNGSAKGAGTPASLFKFSAKNRNATAQNLEQEFAERHLRSIKLILHPNVLKLLKVKQTDTGITIATERCYPLSLETVSTDPALGLAQIISALNFLHTKCHKTHCLVSPTGVVVRDDGSWCLTSFECTVDNDTSIHRVLAELKWHASWSNGWRMPSLANASASVRQLDQWGLGALMCWVHTLIAGQVDLCVLSRHDRDIYSLKRYAPANLHELIDQLMSPDHDVDLEAVLKTHPYFTENEGISAMSFATEFHIKNEEQMSAFFSQLPTKLTRIPNDIAVGFAKCWELYGAVSLIPSILESVVVICKSMLLEEFKVKVYPHISKLFKENDRAIRYSLLRLMPDLDPMLDENQVSDDLLEPLLIGFGDTASQIRDETVKAMVYVMKKIKKRQQQNAAMMLFKCVEDCEPTIRVNTIICFAKIIPFVQHELVEKVVPQVWRLGLSDTFLKSKLATLESISASHGFFGTKQKVEILLPLACNTLLDSEPQVRRMGFDTIHSILDSLKEHVAEGGNESFDSQWAGVNKTTTQHKPQHATHPMTLVPSVAQPGVPRNPGASLGMPGQRSQHQHQLLAASQERRLSASKETPLRPATHDVMDELEDFFDPFPPKR
ncbi:protein kinase, putative [Babesia bigemina]|uniref:Protein kinase, putative n=1 Tax=Babesia bigemina TaxID=5866 RepID=A0A061D2J3_BABBI|nr:protein kinase, putative [Babesia bigemina]CDR94292.1 protein kinase, putative [Babesia bigemina]|eukprot:XP_012766478.1 protein kinase, putative [Babesia bigemina]